MMEPPGTVKDEGDYPHRECSTQSTARLLSQRDFRVFGTSRQPASAEIIPGVEMRPPDVRTDDLVQACVEAVSTRAGRLDVLINTCGVPSRWTRLNESAS